MEEQASPSTDADTQEPQTAGIDVDMVPGSNLNSPDSESPKSKPKTNKEEESDSLMTEESSSTSNNTASTSSDSGIQSRMSRKRGRSDDDERDSPIIGLVDSSCSSGATVIESSDSEEDVKKVVKKSTPKPNWHLLPEFIQRQIGYSTKLSHPSLFQQRCYGSLRSVQRLELMYKLEEHKGCVNSLHFNPDGTLLASGSDDLQVVIWDWRIGQTLLKIPTRHRRNIFQTKFLDLKGPDLHFVTCARDGQVWYYQIGTDGGRKETRRLGQHRKPCHKLAVLKEQPHVVLSAGEDGLVLSHDLRSNGPNKLVHVQNADHDCALYSIHPDPLRSHQFCVAGQENTVRIYDQRRSSVPVTTLSPFPANDRFLNKFHVTCAVYNHDGSDILASYTDDDIYLMASDGSVGEYKCRYSGHRNYDTIKSVAFFGPRSEFVMSGSDCGHLFFWERKSEAVVQFLLADDNGVVNCMEPHPQLPFLATSGLDWDVKIWVPSCEEEPSLKGLAEIVGLNRQNVRSNGPEYLDDNEMLWLLWRRLRAARGAATDRARTARERGDSDREWSTLSLELSDFSSDSSSSDESRRSSNDDDDLGEDMAGCATS